MSNFWLKIASVLLAMTLWMVVMSKGRTEVLMEVPLMFRDVPQGLQVKDSNNMNVTVHLRGEEGAVTSVRRSDVKAFLTLSDARSGFNTIQITPADVKVPTSVAVIKVNPASIKVELETVQKKTLPIEPVITGTPSAGYEVKGIVVTPSRIEVEGPLSEMKGLNEIKTRAMDVSLASGSVAERVGIDIEARGVKTSVDTVRVIVKIDKIDKKGGAAR